jgi:hypothetical protein
MTESLIKLLKTSLIQYRSKKSDKKTGGI